jgi:hypothetical protein
MEKKKRRKKSRWMIDRPRLVFATAAAYTAAWTAAVAAFPYLD